MMRGLLRLLVRTALIGGVAYAMRDRLVEVLTRTTGTWVGSPND